MWMVIVACALLAGTLASLIMPVIVFAALLAGASVAALLTAVVVRSFSIHFVVLLGGAVICSQVAYVLSIAGYALLVRHSGLGASLGGGPFSPQGEWERPAPNGDPGRPEV